MTQNLEMVVMTMLHSEPEPNECIGRRYGKQVVYNEVADIGGYFKTTITILEAKAAAAVEVVRHLIKVGEQGEQEQLLKRPKESEVIYRIKDELFVTATAPIWSRLAAMCALFDIRNPVLHTDKAHINTPKLFNCFATFSNESRYPARSGKVVEILGTKKAREVCKESVFKMLVENETKDLKVTYVWN